MKTLYKIQNQQDVQYYEKHSDAYHYAADIGAEVTSVQAVPLSNNSYALVSGNSCRTFNQMNSESLTFCVTPDKNQYHGGGLYYNFNALRNQPNGNCLVYTSSETTGDSEYSSGTITMYVYPADQDIQTRAYALHISHQNPETLKQLVMQEIQKRAQYVYKNNNEITFIDLTQATVVKAISPQAPQAAASARMFAQNPSHEASASSAEVSRVVAAGTGAPGGLIVPDSPRSFKNH
ncbi:MAG: hypothetical protein P4M12_04440 [Gammaproteobacteria bacterium]|nr:hypothetical protein [Gammaproteobacteria bacterium]